MKEKEIVVTRLRHFPDIDGLKAFLEEDKTDGMPYSENFTCRDFSLAVVQNAWRKGYFMGFVYEWDGNFSNPAHAYCLAYVEAEGLWVFF